MSERDEAIRLANLVLDRSNADPDDDLALLARQFLRALEAYDRLKSDFEEARERDFRSNDRGPLYAYCEQLLGENEIRRNVHIATCKLVDQLREVVAAADALDPAECAFSANPSDRNRAKLATAYKNYRAARKKLGET